MIPINPQWFAEFIAETNEHLTMLCSDLLLLELTDDPALINRIFRTVHSIKGNAGIFALKNITEVAHTMESCFALVRDKKIVPDKALISLFLNGYEKLQKMINDVENSEKIDTSDVISKLMSIITEAGESFTPLSIKKKPEHAPSTPATQIEHKPEKSEVIDNEKKTTTQKELVRVPVNLLDDIMTITGELVLARNRLSRIVNSDYLSHDTLAPLSQKIDLITSQLQDKIMSMRLQPISSLFSKFDLLIRNLETVLSKQIKLDIKGEDVLVDKAIIENLSDPLTHIIKNAADHGIERPEVRERKGKDPSGTITLKASQNSGMIYIEISDDGQGFDEDRILEKALDLGLTTMKQAKDLTQKQIFDFVFAPAFSTSNKVDDISGRGVGMNIVLVNIEKLGGMVKIDSEKDKGMTITLSQPLTLAIIPSVLFKVNDIYFVVPQVVVKELRRIKKDEYHQVIEQTNQLMIMHINERNIPIAHFCDVFQLVKKQDIPKISRVLILKYENTEFGVIVDEIIDNEEIVVQPIPKFFKKIDLYLGTTILEDGSVGLIIDVKGIADRINLNSEKSPKQTEIKNKRATKQDKKTKTTTDTQKLLIFENAENEYFGINLNSMQHIKMIKHNDIDQYGIKGHTQYEGKDLRIVRLDESLPVSKRKIPTDTTYIIIPKMDKNHIGIFAYNIMDIVETKATIVPEATSTKGIIGTITIDDKQVRYLDIFAL